MSLPFNKSSLCVKRAVAKTTCLVVDGSAPGERILYPPADFHQSGDMRQWKALSMVNHDLHIIDTKKATKGVSFSHYSSSLGLSSPFRRVPRHSAVNLMGMRGVETTSRFIQLLKEAERNSTKGITRGSTRHVFTNKKYVRLGVSPCRANTGFTCTSQSQLLSPNSWREMCTIMSLFEKLYRAYIPTQEISTITAAKKIIGFPSAGDYSNHPNDLKCSIFSALAFSANSHTNMHVDDDFCQGLVTIQQEGVVYEYRMEPVVYFCFPCLGVAVPLRPGDVIIFNAQEPHCLSSQVRPEQEIYSIGMYLKTGVVGLNDNSLPLTPDQELVYNNIRSPLK